MVLNEAGQARRLQGHCVTPGSAGRGPLDWLACMAGVQREAARAKRQMAQGSVLLCILATSSNILLLLGPYHFCLLLSPFCIEYSLGISNFFEEISSLSRSIVFHYFFAMILRKAFLTLLAILGNSEFECRVPKNSKER